MAKNPGVVYFPVVFFDGEKETNIGNVGVHHTMDFKDFQSILGQAIGISPHKISVSLIYPKKSGSKKIPITEKVNFGAICREKDCFFNVALKRPRKERRRKPRQNLEEDDEYTSLSTEISPNKDFSPEMVVLRRIPENKPSSLYFSSPLYDRATSAGGFYTQPEHGLGLSDYKNYKEEMYRKLQFQQQKYMMAIDLNAESNARVRSVDRQELDRFDHGSSNDLECEECMNARGKRVAFHLCVRDPIVVGFRTKAGPIARPSRASD